MAIRTRILTALGMTLVALVGLFAFAANAGIILGTGASADDVDAPAVVASKPLGRPLVSFLGPVVERQPEAVPAAAAPDVVPVAAPADTSFVQPIEPPRTPVDQPVVKPHKQPRTEPTEKPEHEKKDHEKPEHEKREKAEREKEDGRSSDGGGD